MSDQPAKRITEIDSLPPDGRNSEDAESYPRQSTELAAEIRDAITGFIASKTFSDFLSKQGFFEEAESYLRQSSEQADALDTLTRCEVFDSYGKLLDDRGLSKEAEPILRQATELAETLDTLTRCKAFHRYGGFLRDQGRLEEAETYLRQAAELAETLDTPTRCIVFENYGSLLHDQGRLKEAERYLLHPVKLAETLDTLSRCKALQRYGKLLCDQGRLEEAETYLRQAAELAEAPDTPDTRSRCIAFITYAAFLINQSRFKEAEPYLHQAAELAETLDTVFHCKVARTYGDFLKNQGRNKEAEKYLRQAAELYEGLDTLTRCNASSSYGSLLNGLDRYKEAEPYLRQAAELSEGLDIHTRCNAIRSYGLLLFNLGRSEAEPYLRQAAELAEGLDALTRCNALSTYGGYLHNQRKKEAGQYLCQAAELAEALDTFTRCIAFRNYGGYLASNLAPQALPVDAERYLRQAAELAETLESTSLQCDTFQHYGRFLLNRSRLKEAEPYLRQAVQLAETLEPHIRYQAFRHYGDLLFRLGRYREAVQYYRSAQIALGHQLADNRYPRGIRTILREESTIYERGLNASHNLLLSVPDAEADNTFSGSEFIDGNKAVWVREALHQLAHLPTSNMLDDAWEPLSENWCELVSRPVGRARIGRRGVRRGESSSAPSVCVRELLAMPSPEDRPVVGPILHDELVAFLVEQKSRGDGNTIYVSFDFVGHDLFVLPLRCGPDGQPSETHTHSGYFVLENAWVDVDQMARQWRQAIDVLLETSVSTTAGTHLSSSPLPSLITLPADQLRRELAALSERDLDNEADPVAKPLRPMVGEWPGYSEPSKATPRPPALLLTRLGKVLRLDAFLDLIEPNRAKWPDLHLVFLPDVQLYQLPLHAAWVDWTERALIDTVASVRYGLSLRTLHTLQTIEQRQAVRWPDGVPLHGTLFANPTGVGLGFRYTDDVAGVTDEVGNLLAETGPDVWRVFGDIGYDTARHATRQNFQRELPGATLLWAACHGGVLTDESDDSGPIASPSLLLCDGPLSSARMVADGYDFRGCWLFHASCCLLAQMESEDSDRQAEGFIAAMMMRGCRRVSGAMWELADDAAAEFARHYVAALKRNVFGKADRDPNAVAMSLKEAVVALRKVDNGRYDHEFFWAAFALYGLG